MFYIIAVIMFVVSLFTKNDTMLITSGFMAIAGAIEILVVRLDKRIVELTNQLNFRNFMSFANVKEMSLNEMIEFMNKNKK